MTDALAAVFTAFLAYTYVGYPLLLRLWSWTQAPPRRAPITPTVEVLIAAYNEESCLMDTIESVLASEYPAEALRVLIVSDGSTDATDAIVKRFHESRVRLIRQEPRAGKVAALKRGAAQTTAELLVLADASSRFFPNTLSRLVQQFADERVGSVSGAKRIRASGAAAAEGDGAYWRYESMLRTLESLTGASWIGCEGGLFAIRRPLFQLDFPTDWAEDYAICCRVFQQGRLNRYEPSAGVSEIASSSLRDEFDRKVRVIVRGIRGYFGFWRLWSSPAFFIQNFSHRLCRWLAPFAWIGLLIVCAMSPSRFWQGVGWLQAGGYCFAAVGFVWPSSRQRPRFLSVPMYWVIVHAAAFVAWLRLGRRFSIWTPAVREKGKAS